ncbi:hypothetical protein CBER1_03329 [Cercospora berteroae]|uniref:Uncharacterized protein n=1 Tax=Cercospora berteroae TaxID=357750 RepID=A0A2S6BQS7_9PEZI|nr:hypothetical protein CBER1_03329 [Cercospora berteroae]
MIDYSGAVAQARRILLDDPVFRTGSDNWDSFLTLALYSLLLASGWKVAGTFIHLYRQARRGRGHHRWGVIHGLLAFSIVSFVIVNVLRWEYRRLKLVELAVTQAWHEAKDTFREKGTLDSLPVDETSWRYRIYKSTYGQMPESLVDSISWISPDWKSNASVFDYFKLLIDEGRRSYWTRQWYMGFLAWSLYASAKCAGLDLGASFAASCILLAYHFSLAAVQALFMALILLVPSSRGETKPRRFVKPVFIVAVALLQSTALVALPWILTKLENSGSSTREAWQSTFALGRSLLLVVSLVSPVILNFDLALEMHPLSEDHVETKRRARVVGWSWAIVGILSLLLHLHALWQCFEEASPGKLWRWTHLALLQPWHDAKYNVFKDSTFRVFGILGGHPWINALGWDVIFSTAGVCMSSVICDTDARAMLQCSLMPWLADALVVAEHGAEVVQDAADEGLTKGMEVMKQAQASVTAGLVTATRKGLDKAQQLASKSNLDIAESIEEKIRRVKDLVDAQGRTINDDGETLRKSRVQRGNDRRITRSFGAETDAGLSPRRNLRSTSARSSSRTPARSSSRKGSKRQTRRASSLTPDEASGIAEQGGLAYALFLVGGLGLASAGSFGADLM